MTARLQGMRTIDEARFTQAVREGLSLPALAERFGVSPSKASVLRRRVLSPERKGTITRAPHEKP